MMKRLLLPALLLGASVSAQAMPLMGGIEITGTVNSHDETTGVDFGDIVILGTLYEEQGLIGDASEDFSVLMGQLANLTDIVFASPSVIWESNGYSFTAESFTDIGPSTQGGIEFTAIGTLSGPGFDPTPGQFGFTSNSSGSGTASFSSSTSAEVPEPASLALMGIGLFGLGIAARRRRREG